ncbi:hypothetical protein FF1_028147 [Malus domestica]
MEFSLSTPHYPNTTSPFSAVAVTVAVVLNLNQKHHSTTTTCLFVSPRSTPLPPPNPLLTNFADPKLPKPLLRRPNPPPNSALAPSRTSLIPPKPLPHQLTPPLTPIHTLSLTRFGSLASSLLQLRHPKQKLLEQPKNPSRTMSPRRIRSYPKLSSGKMGHSNTELNAGFGFVIYGGTTAAKSAMKAVEFDGVEFHGRVLTVKLDDGRRLKDKTDERARWLEGYDGVGYRSQWHKERESSRNPRIGKQLFGGEYGLMVKHYARQGDMHRARETFASKGNRTIITCVHKGWRNEKSPRDFDMMRMSGCIPTVHTFNALVLGLVEKRQMQRAVEILDAMTLAGIIPDEHTYTTIMHGYASLGDNGKAFECFTKLRREGLELDVFTYEALLKACCKAGRMQSALAVTTEMGAKNIPRNTFIYNILIDGWARIGDVWEAADLMHQMKKEGVRPDIHTYTSFINASCKAGDIHRTIFYKWILQLVMH